MAGNVVPFGERRAPRLVTMQIPFRVAGPDGLELEGHTTGLNEHGLAGRVNLVAGRIPEPPGDLPVRIVLDLPREKGASELPATIIRVDASWVPGFTHFLAFRFVSVSAEDIAYFRRFIQWRDDAYFTEEKPNRQWYLYRTSEEKVYGPLTTEELKLTLQRQAYGVRDLIWSPQRGSWIPLHEDILEERLKGDDAATRSTATRSGAEPERRSMTTASGDSPAGAAASPARAARAEAALAVDRPRRNWAAISLGVLTVALLLSGSVAFWTGWWDFTAAGQVYRDAERLRSEGQGYRALVGFDRFLREYPTHRRASAAAAEIAALVREDRALIDAALMAQPPAAASPSADPDAPPPGVLLGNDFDRDGLKGLEVECPVGAWTGNPGDPTVECATTYTSNVRYGDKGSSLQISYRVQSAVPGFAGAWMRLRSDSVAPTVDLTPYKTLAFMIRGTESDRGFSQKLRLELRNADAVGSVIVSGIGTSWKRFRIPLEQFGLADRRAAGEIRFVLESTSATDQDGVLFLDDVQFEK